MSDAHHDERITCASDQEPKCSCEYFGYECDCKDNAECECDFFGYQCNCFKNKDKVDNQK